MTIKWTMMGGSWPRTTYQPSVVEKISFSLLETGKKCICICILSFWFKKYYELSHGVDMDASFPPPPFYIHCSKVKRGEPYNQTLATSPIISPHPPPTPTSPTTLSPNSPLVRSLEYSDGLTVIAP